MFKPVLPIVGLFLLAACSTAGKGTPLTSTGGPTRATDMALNVHGGCEDGGQCEELRSELASRLVGAGMAERIVAPWRPADLSLDVQVDQIHSVSGTARVLFGALAGRNSITSTDMLQDRSGMVLRSFRVESASASHPFSGESNLSDACRQFASDTISALR